MLPITSCTVCRRFTQLFQYSIESIVNIIDEILILDDSCEEDVDYTNFAKYSNIKIIKSDEFGNDLGKKKQYLANISCLLYTSPSPRDKRQGRMPSSA